MNKKDLIVIILAAGEGTRMKSSLPKVCHKLAGKPLLSYVLSAAEKLQPKYCYVVNGHEAETVIEYHKEKQIINWIRQEKQLGTGHAVAQVLPHIKKASRLLILCGDVPLITQETLTKLVTNTPSEGVGIITGHLENPFGLGRIIRNEDNNVVKIIEEKDASIVERKTKEVFSGIMILPSEMFENLWPKLTSNNKQKEFYLTDVIAQVIARAGVITTVAASFPEEILGVNDRYQLTLLERIYQHRKMKELMQQGVAIRDMSRVDIRGDVKISQDVEIDINVILEGNVKIGSGTSIGPNVIIKDAQIGKNVLIKANTVIDGADIATNCTVGPFARIRPGTRLEANVSVGNFVEIKKSTIDENSKVNHLSYIGDSTVGKNVNIGAGTITCNYDGAKKHKTIIEDDVFVGSNTQLVAPVTLGKGCTVGAGTTITRDVSPQTLAISRVNQKIIASWVRPTKEKK